MRVTEAFSTMFRLAVQNPSWAFANLLAVALNKSGLQFAAIYMGLVIVAGVTAGPMFLEAGFQEGTWVWGVFNIAFMIFMALLILATIAPSVLLHFGHLDAETHGSARLCDRQGGCSHRPRRLRPPDWPRTEEREAAALRRSGPSVDHGADANRQRSRNNHPEPAHRRPLGDLHRPQGRKCEDRRSCAPAIRPVHILDPFGVTGTPSAAFNPLDALDPDGLDVAEDASTLADALVLDEPGGAPLGRSKTKAEAS